MNAKPRTSKKSLLIFLLPSILLVIVFFALPVILTGVLSFTDMDFRFNWDFVGFQSYISMFTDFLVPTILKNTFLYVFLTLIFFNLGTALLLALLTTSINDRLGSFFRLIWMLPRLTPSVVYGLLWLWTFDPTDYGLINVIRKLVFHMPAQNWLQAHPMMIIVVANGFVGASFGMVLFTSAIKSIPRDYLYAARVDGGGWWFTVRKVILPLIKWQILFITTYQTLSLLTSFEYIYIITDGGPAFSTEVWALYTYHSAFQNFRFGYGAALSMILVIVGVISAFVYLKFFRFKEMIQEPRIEVNM